MSIRTIGNTVYTAPMAKVMISVPDPLLERLDAHVRTLGETRSGFLQRVAEAELDRTDLQVDDEVGRLLDEIEIEAPADLPAGSDVARLIREDRESR
jgi:hypothetical protein